LDFDKNIHPYSSNKDVTTKNRLSPQMSDINKSGSEIVFASPSELAIIKGFVDNIKENSQYSQY